MPNILRGYLEVVKENLDAPEIFIEASAYHIVSACLGRFFHCSLIPGGKLGGRPNVWFVLSSIPGRTRRSTVSNYAQYVYRKSLEKFNVSRFKMDEKLATKRVFDSIIEEGTPEGIVDHIQATELRHYCIVSTEFGSVLQRMGTKDYELGVSTLYSKLYYGESHSMMLSQRGKDKMNRFLPSGIYVNMFCGMQEANEYITRTMSRQGLLRRIIIVFCSPEEIKDWIPPINSFRENVYHDLWTSSEIIYETMNDIVEAMGESSISSFDTSFHPKAMKIINTYARENDDALKKKVTDANIYMQSFWEHLAKLSMLEAISEKSFLKEETPPKCWVTERHTLTALDFLKRATKHNRDIINNLGKEEEKILQSTVPLERIYQIIKKKPEVSRAEVYRVCNMNDIRVQSYLRTLVRQERIHEFQKKTGSRYSTFYKVLD